MRKILQVKQVNDYCHYLGCKAQHPLICIIDYATVSPLRHSLNRYSVYGIFLRDDATVDLTYGCGAYAYQSNSLLCVAPGQLGGKEDNGERVSINGWALLFHPDLLAGTPLASSMDDYPFFYYSERDALCLLPAEHDLLVDLFQQLRAELTTPADAQTRTIIISYLQLLLNYCQRFYLRRHALKPSTTESDVLTRLEQILQEYFAAGQQLRLGLPSVQYCADKLCLSPNYCGELIKKLSGETAATYIRRFILQLIKNRLSAGKSVTQTAAELGFAYPQHLSRMFKDHSGLTPSQYIHMIKDDLPSA